MLGRLNLETFTYEAFLLASNSLFVCLFVCLFLLRVGILNARHHT
jgi:cell division protein FtsL